MSLFKNVSKIGIALLPFIMANEARADANASANFDVRGTAPAVCLMPEPTNTGNSNATVSNKTITITTLINQADARVQPWSSTFFFNQVMCNYNAVVRITSDNRGMTPTQAVPNVGGQFLNKINYTVNANWGGVSLTLNTLDAASASVPSGGANQGDLTLVISTLASSLPLVEGVFQDTIRINLGLSM
jgi:hypothetical protein